ncbi:DUF2007 domain-containing protein [Limibacterium fermenti]|uniref:putative signal transducing protein n=1 Tax=Limibacterium fermenti TaxID=3229863 RepID=UPI003A6C12A0
MERLVTIKTFTYPHEAYILQTKLEDEGIPTFLKDEKTVQVYNFYSNAIGGVKLQIWEKDTQRAQKIIEETEGPIENVYAFNKRQIKDTTHCPFCLSDNIGVRKRPSWLTFLPYFVIGAIFPFYKKTYTCFRCGKKWKIKG